MSRTDELKGKGATQISGGGADAPFLKWPEKGGKGYAYIEGKVLSMWEGQYGPVLVMTADHGEGIKATLVMEEGAEPEAVRIEQGMVLNVGMGSTVLKGFVANMQVGHEYHIAFTGWEKSRTGNTYRMFEVLDLNAPEPENGDEYTEEALEEDDSSLPF